MFLDNLFDNRGLFDPWIGDPVQSSRLKAYCRVFIDGFEITDKIDPHLVSVRVTDTSPKSAIELEVDDRDGRLPLPKLGSLVTMTLGWATGGAAFTASARILDIEYGVQRGSAGRAPHC